MTAGVALVSGAADGIGFAIATTFAAAGYRVGMLDIANDRLAAAVARLADDGATVAGEVVDVSDVDAVATAVGALTERWGPPTAVVSNAGIAPYGELLDMTQERWRRVVDVNLTGTFAVTTAAARAMVSAGVPGSICCVASGAAFLARAGAGPYCATKAAVVMHAKVLALELGPHGIRANAVAPGFIDHGERAGLGRFASPEYVATNRATVPLARTGIAQDVADAVSYLASPQAAFINGAVLSVDGGSTAGRFGQAWDVAQDAGRGA